MAPFTSPSSRVVENRDRHLSCSSSTIIPQNFGASREAPSSSRPKPLHFNDRKSSSRLSKRQNPIQIQPTYPPSPPPSHHKHTHTQTSPYDQTTQSPTSIKSHYQQTSTLDLPSATKWPSQNSVAERRRIEDDLLGIGFDQIREEELSYSTTTRIPDDDFVCADEFGNMNVEGFGGGGYGMTMRGEGGMGPVFAWNQDRYGYDFVDRIDDVLPGL